MKRIVFATLALALSAPISATDKCRPISDHLNYVVENQINAFCATDEIASIHSPLDMDMIELDKDSFSVVPPAPGTLFNLIITLKNGSVINEQFISMPIPEVTQIKYVNELTATSDN